jgi:hypothetical protein
VKKAIKKKADWMVKGVGPEFKPQYKKKKENRTTKFLSLKI